MLSAYMREMRESTGRNRTEVAAECPFTPAAIKTWESGTRVPHLPNLMDLCKALGMDPDQVATAKRLWMATKIDDGGVR